MTKHTEYFDKEINNKIESLKRAIEGDAPKIVLEKILEEIDIIKDAKLALILPAVSGSLTDKEKIVFELEKNREMRRENEIDFVVINGRKYIHDKGFNDIENNRTPLMVKK